MLASEALRTQSNLREATYIAVELLQRLVRSLAH